MKLKFEKPDPRTKNVYLMAGDVLEKAIRSALKELALCEKNMNDAIQAVFSAFYNGMGKGYRGLPYDDGKAECGKYMATANPETCEFNLYMKIL
jgi:hypothetical protein